MHKRAKRSAFPAGDQQTRRCITKKNKKHNDIFIKRPLKMKTIKFTSKIDYRIMQIKSVAECSNTLDLSSATICRKDLCFV